VADEHEGALAKKDGALVGAGMSAAIAIAAYGLRRALAENSEGLSLPLHLERDKEKPPDRNGLARSGELVISAFESYSDSLLPLAEAAAERAGRWMAQNSPALVRDRLLPRFIDAFKAAA
jgi:hypothetical protein